MSNPLFALYFLNEANLNLDMTQSWIDASRDVSSTTDEIQRSLDRQQKIIDEQREQIARTMAVIARSN